MKILAVDSACATAAVCVADDNRLVAEYTLQSGNTHSETLLPMIEAVIRHAGITADDIDLFAAVTGPGSFTGVRIGVSTVKGLAFGRGKPCVGVSTLESLARNLEICEGIICPVMNARRNQVYTAIFRSDGKKVIRLTDDSAISVEELLVRLAEYRNEKIYFCGDGYTLVKSQEDGKIKSEETPERLRHNSAFSAALAALDKYTSGEFTTDANLGVTYLRPSQAERERNEKLKEKI